MSVLPEGTEWHTFDEPIPAPQEPPVSDQQTMKRLVAELWKHISHYAPTSYAADRAIDALIAAVRQAAINDCVVKVMAQDEIQIGQYGSFIKKGDAIAALRALGEGTPTETHKDTLRLDFLERTKRKAWSGEGLRAAIDAAMENQK